MPMTQTQKGLLKKLKKILDVVEEKSGKTNLNQHFFLLRKHIEMIEDDFADLDIALKVEESLRTKFKDQKDIKQLELIYMPCADDGNNFYIEITLKHPPERRLPDKLNGVKIHSVIIGEEKE